MELSDKPHLILGNSRQHWLGYLTGTIVALAILPLLPAPYSDPELLVALIGGLWAFAFFMKSRHAEDARFMKELLESFNKRYNDMNDDLRRIQREDQRPFTPDQEDKFVDYFNLCAEEWLFWRQGYVYAPVWKAWENGMKQYAKDERVQALWLKERKTGSYYGFEFPAAHT